MQQKLMGQTTIDDKKLVFIKTAYRLEQLLLTEVLYIEGMRDYRKIVTLHKPPVMTLQTFTSLELEMPARLICRVHKSYMVALDKIESIEKDTIKMSDTTKNSEWLYCITPTDTPVPPRAVANLVRTVL